MRTRGRVRGGGPAPKGAVGGTGRVGGALYTPGGRSGRDRMGMAVGDWWQRLVGTARRLGLWTLPAFLVVGLAGAVMAGGLAVVFYSLQVGGLEAETRESREQLSQAVEDVQKAGDEALEAIRDEVESVRESLTRDVPIEDVNELGVVVIRAIVGAPPPAAPPPPPADQGTEAQGAPDTLAAAQEQPPASEQPTQQPTEPAPPPSPSPRVGVGFAVAAEGPTTYFATSFGLVADDTARAGVVEAVEVVTANGTFRGVVHSWDDGRDLALIRAEAGQFRIGEWRPSERPLAVGERLTIAGVTPTLDAVFLNAVVGYADVTMVVADIPVVEFLRGAPIVDQSGHVVAVYTLGYRPFGGQAGDGQAIAPIGLLCERMLRNCEDLEAEPSETATEG